jgi:tetratricopeptide (TPR) repeat protein
MSRPIGWVPALTCSLTLTLGFGAAQAGESGSISIYGESPVRACGEAAELSAKSGTPSFVGLAACTDAVQNPLALTEGELAASYLNRSVLLLAAGNHDAAITDASAALRLQPDLTEAFLDRAAAFMAKRRFSDAVADLTRALALAPKQPAEAYYDRACAREELGDLQGAYADYREATRMDPAWDRPKTQLARFKVVEVRKQAPGS